jgi:hypothetical protein
VLPSIRGVVGLAMATALTLGGCGGDSGSDDQASGGSSSADVVIDIDVHDGTVTPMAGRVDVEVGQKVTLHIRSDAAEEIHVHSQPEHEYELAAGDDVRKSFTVYSTGIVSVEAHHLDETIVRLVVRP